MSPSKYIILLLQIVLIYKDEQIFRGRLRSASFLILWITFPTIRRV